MSTITAVAVADIQNHTIPQETTSAVYGYLPSVTDVSSILLPIIHTIVCIVGLIGNGLVIFIIYRKTRNTNITDLYILNLAIADLLFVAMLPFWSSSIALNRWVFGKVICKIVSGSTYVHMYASVFFLTAMSVDRFIAVVMYQSCRRTKLTAKIVIVGIWITSAILGILPVSFRNALPVQNDIKCKWTFNENVTSHYSWFHVFTFSRSVVGFLLPFIVIIVNYSLIIIFLKTRKTRGRLTEKCENRATKLVLVVIAVFLICWLPLQISNLFYVAQSLEIMPTPNPPSRIHYYAHMTSTCLAWMHSCMNPILYAFMREDMRRTLSDAVDAKRCCGDNLLIKQKDVSDPRKDASQRNSRKSNFSSQFQGRDSFTGSFRMTTVREQSSCKLKEDMKQTNANLCADNCNDNNEDETIHLNQDIETTKLTSSEKERCISEDDASHVNALTDHILNTNLKTVENEFKDSLL